MKRTRELQFREHPDWEKREKVSGCRDFDGEDRRNLYIQNLIQEINTKNNFKKNGFQKNSKKIKIFKIMRNRMNFNILDKFTN